MNRQLHRLVFNPCRGLWLAVAETARPRRKAGGRAARSRRARQALALASLGAGLALALPAPAPAQTRPPVVFASQLPVPAARLPVQNSNTGRSFVYDPAKGDPLKGGSSADLYATGQVKWTRSEADKTATFDQGSLERVVINWDSFNIGAGYKVHFTQDKDPSRYVSALNRIWSADPSVILGSLTADREVILLNANGVYFGRGARVDTGKFVATANAIADSVFEKGLRNITDGSAVFSTAGADYQATQLSDSATALSAAVSVEAGAEIRSAAGGDVLLVAPRVLNAGRIETPAGQTVLAAGDKVYLMSSSDPKQRGLIVAVDPVKLPGGGNDTSLGLAANTASGAYKTLNGATVADSTPDSTAGLVQRINEIRAESGTVNLVGLTVRQAGQINATTAVKGANGAIFLQAMASTLALPGDPGAVQGAADRGALGEPGSTVRLSGRLGTVEMGAGSLTAVQPDGGAATQIDAEVFNRSLIHVEAAAIAVDAGAQVLAPSGRIEFLATQNADNNPIFFPAPGGGVGTSDASRVVIAPGATISAAGLRDVAVDGARNQGTQRLFRIELADAPVQRSGPLYRSQVYFDLRDGSKISVANVGGAAASVGRTASERSTAGGSISIQTDGALVVGEAALLDVSGGSVRYSPATLQSSLLTQNGRLVNFRSALSGNAVTSLLASPQLTAAPGYVDGADGGSLLLSGRRMVLAGNISGEIIVGERQVQGLGNVPQPGSVTFGRRDEGSYYLSGIEINPASTPHVDPSIFVDPLQSTLPGLGSTFDLSLAKVGAGGFGGLALRAQNVAQPGYGAINLGIGGNFDVEALTLSLNGGYSAAGGRISLVTPLSSAAADSTGEGDIHLAAATRLNVAGLWRNDTAGAADGNPVLRAQVDGGTINVNSSHSLLAQAGSTLDVSGGAHLAASGTLIPGKAGSLRLTTGTNPLLHPTLALDGAWLRGFDFGSGGFLQLGAPELTVGDGPASGFVLRPDFFSASGFGSIGVDTQGDVRLVSGTQLAPRLLNWQLSPGYRAASSAEFSPQVATPQRTDTTLAARSAVSLSFRAQRPLYQFGGADVQVERGASVDLDPGASLALSATRNLSVGASGGSPGQLSSLTAPGGTLALSITGKRGSTEQGGDLVGFVGSQALWLGAGARLSVDGTVQLRKEPATAAGLEFGTAGVATPADQRQTGAVWGGGSISLNAARGYVIADAGSSMSLNGASAALNYAGLPAAVTVARPAGNLNVSSPEGFVLDGRVSAQGPRDAAGHALADGGRLNLAVGLGGVLPTDVDSPSPYPTAARTVSVGAYDGWLASQGAGFGSDLSLSLGNGTGFVRSSMLAGAGFGGVQLGAGDLVRFDGSLRLDTPLGLQLNAPAIAASPGAQVWLTASYARLGDAVGSFLGRAPDRSAKPDTSAAHDTRLSLTATTIEVYGDTGLQGYSTVTLDAGASLQGEIRFSSGNPRLGADETLRRQLNFAGELQLTAGQIYATSASQYTLNGRAATGPSDTGSSVTVRNGAAGTADQSPLSAFASLTVQATDIDQGGTLRQPFGQINLQAARQLTLGAGSLTSVSGADSSVLFGQTNNLSLWSLPGGISASSVPLAKGVNLSADSITTAASARVSASGGGTVRAWEFFPGVGGSKDYFDTPGLYAVLPDYAASQAVSLSGGALAAADIRQFVVTMAGSGLAPGRYTLLPARDALLAGDLPQGAFLVSRATDQGKSLLRAPVLQDDGSVVVTGYLTSPGSGNSGAPGERFVVEPSATFLAKSDIRLTDVSALLSSQASARGAGRPALPLDGGQVQVGTTGGGRSLWQAELDLAAAGGAAGLLDLAATHVALVDDLAKTPLGALGLSAKVIADSGAGSVLLGGRRTPAATAATAATAADAAMPTWTIDASGTRTLSVDLGTATLQAEELLLASSGSVTLAEGTHISANSSGTLGRRTLASTGDGVIAAISANPLEVRRTGAALISGNLSIGADSVLAGPQINLDATGAMQIAGSTRLEGQALALGARRLVLGSGAVADPGATVLGGALLSAVRSASDLSLRGYASIDFVGEQNWSQRPATTAADPDPVATVVQQHLVLDSPLLRGVTAADGTPAHADIAAAEIQVRNNTGQTAANAGSGAGSFVLQALPALHYGQTGGLTLGPGNVRLAFTSAGLRSSGDIIVAGAGGTTAQQDLLISSARLTATADADQQLAAQGALHVAVEAGSRSLDERVGAGARLSLSAASLLQDGRISLPGGQLSLRADGSSSADPALSFGAGSSTSVAGFALDGPSGFTAFGTPGSIRAEAVQGRLELLGTLDVSAARRGDGSAGEGDAGSVRLLAAGPGGELVLSRLLADGSTASGTLKGLVGAGAGDVGARLVVDVDHMASADGLARMATAGGFGGELSLRVRQGDLSLDESITARHIDIAADSGSLRIGSGAPGSTVLSAVAPAGGVVQLTAGQDLVLGAGARVDARSTRAGANGGDILLASSGGRVSLDASATVDASGLEAPDGRIVIRALRGADGRSVQVDRLVTRNLNAGEVDIEAVRVYEDVQTLSATDTGDPGTLSQTTIRYDNNAYMAAKAGVLSALGVGSADSGRVNLRAGVEVRAGGDLWVSDDWNFGGTRAAPNLDRPGGDAGFLSLRAAGNLLIGASLSDGFGSTGALNDNARSWSYRLVGGADLQAANPLSVRDLGSSGEETGHLLVDAGKVIRTGAGSIELAAGRDLVFATSPDTAAGVVYVSGRKLAGSAAPPSTLFSGQVATPSFTTQGGRLDVFAMRDVVAPEANQLVGNWFWRAGLPSTKPGEGGLYAANSQLAWWTQFNAFGQLLGSFGGGNLNVEAGRDLVNVQAMVPSAGWADSRIAATANLKVINGGDVTAVAGRDLLGGQFFLGRGEGRLSAGRTIGLADANSVILAPTLALMDGTWRARARSGLTLAAAFNPTAVLAADAQNRVGLSPFFYTWGSGAAMRLVANSGDLNLIAGIDESQAQALGLVVDNANQTVFSVLPPTLALTAAAGMVDLSGLTGAVMFPSATGQLQLWAGKNVQLIGAQLAMSDSRPADWAPPSAPVFDRTTNAISYSLIPNTLNDLLPLTGLHGLDPEPARIHADGSLEIEGASLLSSTLLLPKPAQLSAGLDITQLSLRAQNLTASDTTRISAGRNVLAGQYGSVELAGPGLLEVSAGGSVDLGASGGLSTSGNLRNATLPAAGASIRVSAATEGVLDLSAFAAAYLQPTTQSGSSRFQQYRDALAAFVASSLQQPGLSFDQAWSAFQAFPAAAQSAFGRQVLAAEVSALYLTGEPPTAAALSASLQSAFDARKAEVLQAGQDALAAGGTLVLPGREKLKGNDLATYLDQLRALSFASLNLDSTLEARLTALTQARSGWHDAVAASLGGTAGELDALLKSDPKSARAQAYATALTGTSGPTFDAYLSQVLLAQQIGNAGATAANFGIRSLPMRQVLYDLGFQAAALLGAGSFTAQPVWPGTSPVMSYNGSLDMTQSSVITQRGGDISLLNPGGAINVGLKDTGSGTNAPKGVIALGGGNIFGFAKGDFQVNTQRVFIVGTGDMTIWSSSGDIDSGRGANTAVAAPPLAARRSVDGVVFEVPATTTGSGLGILADASGQRAGTIGLYPAFGEILALDAYIRAPSVVLGGGIKGGDNVQSPSVGGSGAAVSAPPLSVAAPAASAESKSAGAAEGGQTPESRPRNSLLTVELQGLGPAAGEAECSEHDRRDDKCPKPVPACSEADKAGGLCR